MANLFDQLATLTEANRKLGLALFEITSARARRQVEINADALTTTSDRGSQEASLATFSFPGDRIATLLHETEENRQAAAGRVKAVADEWRESTQGLFSPAAIQEQWVSAFESVSNLFTPLDMQGGETSGRGPRASPAKIA